MKTNLASLTAFVATAGLALASSALTATPAEAFSLSADPQFGTTNGIGTGATATLNFNFVDSAAGVLLNLGIVNTTGTYATAGGATNSSLVAVAFDVLDGFSASLSSAAGSTFTQFWSGVDISGLHNGFDYGISTPRNSFNGGNANGGLYKNDSTTVSFLLGGTGSMTAAQTESAFLAGFKNGSLSAGVRFQQVAGSAVGTSDKVMAGLISEPTSEPVPEPITMVGMGMGLAGLVAARRKQGNKTTV